MHRRTPKARFTSTPIWEQPCVPHHERLSFVLREAEGRMVEQLVIPPYCSTTTTSPNLDMRG